MSVRAVLGVVGLLVVACPSPATAWADLVGSQPAGDPTRVLVAAVALLAHGLAAWLLVTAALTAGAEWSGALGRLSRVVLRRVAPAVVRRGVALALGVGLGVGGPPASAHEAVPAAGAVARDLDWPRTGTAGPTTGAGAEASDRDGRPRRTASARDRGPAGDERTVVVRRGDTLWHLAAARLPRASRADVAAAWPTWWSVNRVVIGDDPDLLHPGQRLLVPD